MEPYSYMKINNVKYIDLLNFFPLPLYAVPKTFGLTELKKGSYDHFWTCMPANRKWDRSLTWSITIEMVWVLLPTKNSKWCTKNRWGCRYQRSSPVRSCIGCILVKFWWYLGDITVSKSTVGAKYCLLSESQWFPLYRFPYFLQPVSDFPKFKKVFHSFSVTVQLGTKLLHQLSHLTRKNLI